MAIDSYNPTIWDDERLVYPEVFTKWEQQFKKIVDELNRHMATPNDHNLTKADLLLGNVNNFGLASIDEAQTGINTQKYMSPLLTAEAIKKLQAIKSINGRTGAILLSKVDVQLSNVENFSVASQEIAEFGVSSTHYMTPLSTRQAIERLGNTVAENKAAQALSDAKAYVDGKFTDTGWLNLILKPGFSRGSTAIPQYRVKNGKVYFRGKLDRVANKLGVFSSTPAGARTGNDYYQGFSLAQQSSVANICASVYAKPNGDLELVSAGNDTSVWLDAISFYID
ncbi:hypothetical protein C5754_13620 [Listeria monocytogenes]|nr:hypothetical protein [Listeria monocytogenes]EAG4642701.1 hypothetical protein [Listeria monocytogenes]EAG7072440.1 hypothetical protein [Listeria monocytogenes]MCM64869.1 hypothetical protein [Listeria monocytogenes]